MPATWHEGAIALVLSAEIFGEYRRVADTLSSDHPDIDLGPILAVLAVYAELVQAPPLPEPVAADPDDDGFLACAVAGRVGRLVSGDRHLPGVSGRGGVRVVTPRRCVDEVLQRRDGAPQA